MRIKEVIGEDATGGGTSAGSVAAVVTPLGGKKKKMIKRVGEESKGPYKNSMPKTKVSESAPQQLEPVRSIITRILGNDLTWTPGRSKLYKDTRYSKTQRVDDYKMKGVKIKISPSRHKSYISAKETKEPMARKLYSALVKAGYPLSGDLLIFDDVLIFQVRRPINIVEK